TLTANLVPDTCRHGGHCATGTYDQRVLDFEVPTIRLTELTTCGGCAAKLGADALAEALSGLGIDDGLDGAGSADLIAGLDPPDDAAVHLVAPDLAVIGTLDFFPPIVDDPCTFGEIAAANALSDVFAMGGRVLFALSVAAIPEDMPTPAFRSMRSLNRRAAEVLVERGVRGATDVTGFGLLGHGLEMARASGTRFVFDARALPVLDGALELARGGVETGGAAHNRRFVASS